MKVTFADYGSEIASSRLRCQIPQRELENRGIDKGNDVLIYGKHLLSESDTRHFSKLVFDICDDHFGNSQLREYYLHNAANADAVTCNSIVMQERIKVETGRDAIVVREPYEHDQMEADIGPFLLWFGHASNMIDLDRLAPELRHPLMVLSNHPDYDNWSQEAQDEAMSSQCIVVIPTGKSMAKSENRMVESIRCGRFVCAEPLPSYMQFDCFFPIGNIPQNVELALSNPADSLARIRAAQGYIRHKYSPATIADEWIEVLKWL